jgi:hypothetical protein
MAPLYFYKARFFLLDQMKYQRRISHLMASGGKFYHVGMLTTYINAPFNSFSSLEKKDGKIGLLSFKMQKEN